MTTHFHLSEFSDQDVLEAYAKLFRAQAPLLRSYEDTIRDCEAKIRETRRRIEEVLEGRYHLVCEVYRRGGHVREVTRASIGDFHVSQEIL